MKQKRKEKGKQITSLLMAGFMAFAGMGTSAVFAEGIAEGEQLPETALETESAAEVPAPIYYTVTLPYDDACTYEYDHEREQKNPEETMEEETEQDILLLYAANEKVEVSIKMAPSAQLESLYVRDFLEKDSSVPYTLTEDFKLEFTMPEKEVWLDMSFTSLDNDLSQTEALPEAPVQTEPSQTETASPDLVETETVSADPAQTEALPADPVQTEALPDNPAQTETVPIGTEAETEEDGLPVQGSIVQMNAITIPFDTWEFDPYTDFREITYQGEQFAIAYVSDNIVYDEAGVYDCIYRVTDNVSGKFWFVLRPVIVAEEGEMVDDGDAETLVEPETETETEMETETETELQEDEQVERASAMRAAPRAKVTLQSKVYNKGNKTLSDYWGCTNEDILSWLGKHINDDYYLGTSYATDQLTKYRGGTDWRSPNGDITTQNGFPGYDDVAGQAALNCTGFIWHVIMKAAKMGKQEAFNTIPAWGGVGAGTWSSWLKSHDVEYKTYWADKKYDNYDFDGFVQAVIEDGYVQPGDIIWTWIGDINTSTGIGEVNSSGNSPHVGFYLGGYFDGEAHRSSRFWNASGANQWWHSSYRNNPGVTGIGRYNAVNLVTPKDACSCITVIKFSKIPQQPGKGKLQKLDAKTQSATPLNANYSLAGAQYTVYSDSACTAVVTILTTGANGETQEVELPIGTYYVKETAAPDSYHLDKTVHTLNVTAGKTATLTVRDEPKMGKIEIQKYDKETGRTTPNNSAVSFAGAQYTVYSDQACTTAVTMLTTNANGYAISGDLAFGTYYVKETTPPTGYTLDTTLHTATINATVGSLFRVVSNEQIIRGSLTLIKHLDDEDDPSGLKDSIDKGLLKGIKFTLQHEDKSVAPVTIVTNRLGVAETGPNALVYGTWYVTEDPATTPEGYKPFSNEVVKVTKNGVELAYVAKNEVIPIPVKIQKKDLSSQGVVAGAKFQILDAEGNAMVMPDNLNYNRITDTFTTDENGIIAFPKKFKAGTYTVKEVKAPYGYLLADPITITLTTESNGETVVVECYDAPQMGTIRFQKTDASGAVLGAGFTFEITVAEDITDASGAIRTAEIDGEMVELVAGTVVATVSTGEDGIAQADNLYLGKYFYQEIASAEHYAVDTQKYPVELTYQENVQTVTVDVNVTNEKTQFDLYKVDSESTEEMDIPLAGISFRIFTTKGLDDDTASRVAAVIEELQNAPLEDVQRKEALLKELTEVFDLGAVYTTDENGQIHVSDLFHDATYYIYETETLPGYNMDTSIYSFHVDAQGLVDGEPKHAIKISNTANLLDITKTDITGEKELPGATLEIKDAKGELIETWVSTEEPHRIKGLPAGEYVLTETLAPEGYALTSDIRFTLTDSMEVQQVTMKDEQIIVSLRKVDESGENAVIGARLAVYNEDKELIEEWVTDGEVHQMNLPIGKYQMVELEAPEKFAKADPIDFEVSADKASYEIIMHDKLIQVSISKQDITNSKELPGAKLIVEDADGNLVDQWVSGSEPHMMNLAAGKYTLLEEIAPDGFELAEKIEFEVTDTMEVQHVTMYDAPKEETIDLTGKKAGETPANGTTPGGGTPAGPTTATSVKTGDFNRFLSAIVILLCSVAGFLTASAIIKKRKQ